MPDLASLGLVGIADEDAYDAMRRLGFSEVGSTPGHFATVFVRKDLPGLAVRVSTVMDGWAAYGLGIMSGALDDVRFAPVVHDIGLLGGDGYVALTELLQPAMGDRQEEIERLVLDLMGNPAEADIVSLSEFPGIGSFVAEVMAHLGKSYLDPKDGNVLFRIDGTPIVNDPCGRVLDPAIRSLIDPSASDPDVPSF
jgi:hypothetical protein